MLYPGHMYEHTSKHMSRGISSIRVRYLGDTLIMNEEKKKKKTDNKKITYYLELILDESLVTPIKRWLGSGA